MANAKVKPDSVAGDALAMKNALTRIDPPPHISLRQRDYPFWDAIMAARPKDKWDYADMAMAANLARCQSDIEHYQAELDVQGPVVMNQRGTPVCNPLHNVLEALSRRAVAFSRMLHVHPEAKDGPSRSQKASHGKQRAAEATLEDADDDLIPRPDDGSQLPHPAKQH